MTPWRVVDGRNGAILLFPKNGLRDVQGKSPRYVKAYCVGEQDYCLPKDAAVNYKRYAGPIESFGDHMVVMQGLIPTHVVFEGTKGASMGDNAMRAKVGDTVLFVHSQANRPSYPHLIGGHGDHVWERGNLADKPQTGL